MAEHLPGREPRGAATTPTMWRSDPARLRPPLEPPGHLGRPRLDSRLDEAWARRLTLVRAGAGYGKSTTLAAWARHGPGPVGWLTLDRDDTSPLAMLRDVLAALQSFTGRVPRALLDPLSAGTEASRVSNERVETLAAHVCHVLAGRLTIDTALVVDEAHAARGATHQLWAPLIRHLPSQLHLIVSSRTETLVTAQRRSRNSEIAEVDATALAFTSEEVAAALELLVPDLDEELIESVWTLTRGWPAAVRLTGQALIACATQGRRQMLERLALDPGSVLNQVTDELLGSTQGPRRRILQALAVLDRITPDLADALGIRAADGQLRELVAQGMALRVRTQTESSYELHDLVRGQVLSRWPVGTARLRKIRRQAAAWHESMGQHHAALEALLPTLDDEAIAALLNRHGAGMVAHGYADLVASTVEKLPEPVSGDLLRLAGDARLVRGNWIAALTWYDRAGATESILDAGLGWRLAMAHYLRGRLDDAAAACQRIDSSRGDPADRAQALAWEATVQWVRGAHPRARELGGRALSVAEQAAGSGVAGHRARAAAHTVLSMVEEVAGNREASAAHSSNGLRHAEQANDLLQIVRLRVNRGSHLTDEGAYPTALEELDEAARLAELAGFANFHALALSNRGEALLRCGRLDEALVDLEGSRREYQQLGSSAVAYPLLHIADLHRLRGELVRACALYREAVAISEHSGDRQAAVPARAGLARALAGTDVGQAQVEVAKALDAATGFGTVAAELAAGWIGLAADTDRTEVRAHAAAAAELAAARHDRAGLAESLELSAAAAPTALDREERLAEARRIWAEVRNPIAEAACGLAEASWHATRGGPVHARDARRVLSESGVRWRPPIGAGLLAATNAESDDALTLRTLGAFAVVRDGIVVASEEWQSRKARDLLKVLVSRRGRPITREALSELLWPDDPDPAVANRLSVALSTVRSVLHVRRDAVSANAASVRLNPAMVVVDVEQFLDSASTGLGLFRAGDPTAAIPHLEIAAELHSGEFLEEDLYEDWSIPLREEVRTTHLSVLRALAEADEQAGRVDRSLDWWRRLIDHDPFDEPAHLSLVTGLAILRRHGQSRRRYLDYVRRMAELGAEPAPYPGRSGPAGTPPSAGLHRS